MCDERIMNYKLNKDSSKFDIHILLENSTIDRRKLKSANLRLCGWTRHGRAWSSMVKKDPVWLNMVQNRPIEPNMAKYGSVWQSMDKYDLVWPYSVTLDHTLPYIAIVVYIRLYCAIFPHIRVDRAIARIWIWIMKNTLKLWASLGLISTITQV